MSISFGYGSPRLRLMASNGSTQEGILYLPATSLGGIAQSFDENKQVDEMLDGSLNVTIKGFYPRFACHWDVYDETSSGRTVGIADGNTPTAEQLVQILTTYRPGRLQFSPSATSPWYVIYLDKLPKILPVSDYATGVDFEVKTTVLYFTSDNSTAKDLV